MSKHITFKSKYNFTTTFPKDLTCLTKHPNGPCFVYLASQENDPSSYGIEITQETYDYLLSELMP